MSLQSHLAELERKHQALEKKIATELAHPLLDEPKLAQLKRQKLVLKDEITRLKKEPEKSTASLH
jgi:hypothetical protein